MLPKYHFALGIIASAVLIFFFEPIYVEIFVLSYFLIDFDHYLWYLFVKKDWSLKNAYNFLKENKKIYRPLMVFHTVEFHALILSLGFVRLEFFFVFAGMTFHSISDAIWMYQRGMLNERRFSLIKR